MKPNALVLSIRMGIAYPRGTDIGQAIAELVLVRHVAGSLSMRDDYEGF